ncbi:MAG TPA: hypothetical protein VFC07_13705 [Verrucomicrobiae bacterium]|nr:hypothetical protein [Verrucomicrobiae bacterium]
MKAISAGLASERLELINIAKHPIFSRCFLGVAVIFGLAGANLCHAQAPSLIWSNSLAAKIFAIDAQTNLYATASNIVYTINGAGAVVQSNAFCPLPAVAQRDNAGNFYFAGSFDGLQDFGGITLMGGCTNCAGGHYAPGWPTCFLAKYNSSGALQWVTQFSTIPPGASNRADDIALNPDGSITVALDGQGALGLAMFSAAGSNLWVTMPYGNGPFLDFGGVTITPIIGTNGYFLYHHNTFSYQLTGKTYDALGNTSPYITTPVINKSPLGYHGRVIPGLSNNVFFAGMTIPPIYAVPFIEENLSDGTFLWTNIIGTAEMWALAGDGNGNFYVGDTNGSFAKYNGNGSQLWTTNYGQPVTNMLVDSLGNSFVNFADGSVARIDVAPSASFKLKAQMVGPSFLLSWPAFYSNSTLEWAPGLFGPWTNVTASPNMIGGNLVISNSPGSSNRFYRLHGP